MDSERKYDIAIVGMMLSSKGGGMPRSMAQQAKIMAAAGHKVTLYIGDSKAMPFTPQDFYLPDTIKVHCSKSIGFWGFGIIPSTWWKLFRNTPSHDILHINGVWNFTTFVAGIIARLRKTPAIISCRCHYGDDHFARMPVLKKILFHTMEKINLWNVHGIHITADWEEETSWRAARRAKSIIKIPNPVDLTDFEDPPTRKEARKHLGLKPDAFYVVFYGRLANEKNLPFLLESFHQADLGPDAYLVFAGNSMHGAREKLEAMTRELGLEQQVQFVGHVVGRERCYWLAAADLFPLPSFYENFCNAAVEAAASGTHCLTSPNVGALEYLPATLVTAKPLESALWIEALREFHRNRPPQQVMSDEIASQFAAERMEQHWVEQYEKMGF